MERKHFHITFFSNSSQKLYPDNTQAAFTCHLPQPVDLDTSSDWEVGLSEIKYLPPNRVVLGGALIDFSQCGIILNGTQITQATDLYNYRAYLETLLTHGSDAAESHLKMLSGTWTQVT